MEAPPRGLRGMIWIGLLALCLAALGVADAVLLELSRGTFTTGYNGVAIDSAGLRLGFAAGSLLLDATLVLVLWAVAIPLLRLIGLTRVQVFGLTAALTLGLSVGLDIVRYRIHTIVGDLLGLGVIWQLAAGNITAISNSALPDLGSKVLALGMVALAFGLVLAVARWVEHRLESGAVSFAAPRTSRIWLGAAVAAGLSLAVLLAPWAEASRVQTALRGKPSAVMLARLVGELTDVDRDGVGLLSRPADPAPFDGSVSPWALDRPGNGSDENRLAGDHPPDFVAPAPVEHAGLRGRAKPDLLLVYLESFRDDLIGAELRGREVTPVLNQLARQGAYSRHAYVHTPYTTRSRAQLFGGRLAPYPDQDTLIDDFLARGYTVAYFSGQDDSFGGSEALVGMQRGHVFYDARQDLDRRTSRSTHPSSLQVSWKTVNERVFRFLDGLDATSPIFLYVNYVDTHFPYHHDQLDDLLGVEPVERGEIRRANAEKLWETYLNTAANVDHAIGQLIERFRARSGAQGTAILVTADHGQAFYEDGFLGHGRALDTAQTRVPLIAWGMGGEWPEPNGAADLRGLIHRHLASAAAEPPPAPRFAPDPERRVLQYLPNLDRPDRVVLRRLDRVDSYDFEAHRTAVERPDGEPLPGGEDRLESAFRELIWSWEALRLEADAREDGAG